MYFQLPTNIYAGKWGDSIIILDAEKDKYFSITEEAAQLFLATLDSKFEYSDDQYIPAIQLSDISSELVTPMISQFIEQGFVEKVDKKNSLRTVNAPLKDGGLSDYVWDYKSSWAPFAKTPKRKILSSFVTLCRVNKLIKKHGIKGVMDEVVKEKNKRQEYRVPSAEEIKQLSDCVDVACALYIKKVYCLGWASTFALEALKRGWESSLLIGAQAIPFYAHAWAECNGQVVNDDSRVREYLAVLFREPFLETNLGEDL